LRIVKYRGSHHGTNEYPFLIDHDGLSVLPVTSLGLSHPALKDRISTGVARLDEMLSGRGYYRGSTILVSGTAGTGKTSLAAHFVDEACRRGEHCLYFLFEESPQQLMRNMRSIGLDLQQWVDRGMLEFHADRPSRFGLETHLAGMQRAVRKFEPTVAVADPVTNLLTVGSQSDVRSMLTRIIDYLKQESITGLFTSLSPGRTELRETDAGISSLMDTWIMLNISEENRKRRRWLAVLKSRGMAHSNTVHEFALTDDGLRLLETEPARPARAAGV
jgi:circadian clock protein KaiC